MNGGSAVALPVDVAPLDRRERLAALFDAHEDRLYRLARRLAGSADDANDLVQDTFLRVAQSLGSIPVGLAQEEAWLVRVLINIRRDQWRKAAVRKRVAVILGAEMAVCPSNAESALIAKRVVWAALDQLPPRRRAIVILHELEGLRPQMIATLLGIREITVRWHLSMGRRDLKRVLQPQMGDAV